MTHLLRQLRVVCSEEENRAMAEKLKVAFATTDTKHVNQHFGSAKGFAIYRIDETSAVQVEASEFGVLSQDGNEDKLDEKISILEGCAAVYCQAVGPSAVKRLMTMGVQPIKVSENAVIEYLIRDLQAEMKAGPSGWLAKAIEKNNPKDESRFDAMAAEGWDE